jgi:hypothetical protein
MLRRDDELHLASRADFGTGFHSGFFNHGWTRINTDESRSAKAGFAAMQANGSWADDNHQPRFFQLLTVEHESD